MIYSPLEDLTLALGWPLPYIVLRFWINTPLPNPIHIFCKSWVKKRQWMNYECLLYLKISWDLACLLWRLLHISTSKQVLRAWYTIYSSTTLSRWDSTYGKAAALESWLFQCFFLLRLMSRMEPNNQHRLMW